MPCQPWSDEEEVIKRANASVTGLGACVWGNDIHRAESIAKRLEAGSVWGEFLGHDYPGKRKLTATSELMGEANTSSFIWRS